MRKFFKPIKVQKKKAGAALLAAAMAAVYMGCGTGADAVKDTEAGKTEQTELNQTTHLNIAVQPIPGYLPLAFLQDQGWIEAALQDAGYDNVEVTYTEFESGPPENEAFASGTQDVGVMGNVPTLSAAAAGQDRKILGVAYNGEKTEALLVSKDSSVTSPEELKGKKIGLVIGSIAQDFAERVLEKEGIQDDEVEFVNLSSIEQQNALATGQVDAIAVWQPMIAQVEAADTGKVLVDGTGLYKCENLISGNGTYITENPDIVKIFLEQYAKAAEEISAHTEKYAEEYASKYSLDPDIVNATISDMNFQVSITDEDKEDLQQTADWLYDSGNVKKQVTVKDIVDTTVTDIETLEK